MAPAGTQNMHSSAHSRRGSKRTSSARLSSAARSAIQPATATRPAGKARSASTNLLGAYGQHTVQAAGLKVSLSGLGVLRVLMASDGLKATELAEQAWSAPGTVTSVVSTLVRGGFVERRPDEADRRVVRLYITDQGRALISYYVPQAAARWRKAFDFVDEADEAVIRRFFVELIDHLSQLLREERGA